MYQTIVTAKELHQNLDHPDWVVFDCRFNLLDSKAGFTGYQDSHIPGAFYLDLERDLSSAITPESGRHPLPDAVKLSATLGRAGVTQNTQVVVYDDCSGAMAARAWWLLKWLGHDAVAVLDGGFPHWKSQYAVNAALPDDKPAEFTASLRNTLNLNALQLQAELANTEILLVDARAAERFRGEIEPIDPIAGHIPGSVNRPHTDNLNNGCFKSPKQLRAEWMALLQGQVSEIVVHMCGSGVTACHNQLAMEIAGLTGSRIYAGSWSEWIRDPVSPIANGQ